MGLSQEAAQRKREALRDWKRRNPEKVAEQRKRARERGSESPRFHTMPGKTTAVAPDSDASPDTDVSPEGVRVTELALPAWAVFSDDVIAIPASGSIRAPLPGSEPGEGV